MSFEFYLQLSIEAVVGFAPRGGHRPRGKAPAVVAPAASDRLPIEVMASDRRFLRSLRITPDVAAENVGE